MIIDTRRIALGLTLAAITIAAHAGAQPSAGTLIVAHGGDSLWNAGVLSAAHAVKTGGPVEVSFLMGPDAAKTRFQDVVDRLERAGAERVVVVPLLASSHSGHYEQIRWLAGTSDSLGAQMRHHLELSGIERATIRLPMCVVPALDDSPELARVLSDRALALAHSRGTVPSNRALLIVGHGPNSAEDNAAWMENLRPIADSVRLWTGFRDVRVDLVRDDAPRAVREEAVRHVRELIVLQSAMTNADALVIPLLVSAGAVSREKVPADLADTPHVYSAAPLLPHPAIVQWIERRVREAHCSQ